MTTRTLSVGVFEQFLTDYKLVSEERMISFTLDGRDCELGETSTSLKSFFSEDKKIFLRISGSQFHLLYDTMGVVLHLFEMDPETLFILNLSEVGSNKLINSLKEFFFKLLDFYHIRYQIYSSELEQDKVNAKNFYVRTYNHKDSISHKAAALVSKYVMPFIVNKDAKPFRKVYLSRRVVNKQKTLQYAKSWPLVQLPEPLFNRIDDEEKIEEFFRVCGFDIVYPENFKTFEDQVNFFYEVDTLISLSGAGLSNAVFMQNDCNIVELFTSHWIWRNKQEDTPSIRVLKEEEHFFYNSIAFEKGQEYIAVNNKDKSANEVIRKFQTNPILKAIIS